MSCDRRTDFRLRLAAAVLASAVIALLDDAVALMWLVAAGGCGCIASVALGETGWRPLARRLAAVNAFVVLVWLTVPVRIDAGGVSWSAEGLHLAATITARTNAIALVVSALLAGLDAYGLARASASLGVSPRFARLMLLMVRYIALIGETWRRLDRAARARAHVARPTLRSLRVVAQLVALLLAGSLLRAERVDRALRARAFSGAFGGLRAGSVPLSHWAWAAATACALLVALALNALSSPLREVLW